MENGEGKIEKWGWGLREGRIWGRNGGVTPARGPGLNGWGMGENQSRRAEVEALPN